MSQTREPRRNAVRAAKDGQQVWSSFIFLPNRPRITKKRKNPQLIRRTFVSGSMMRSLHSCNECLPYTRMRHSISVLNRHAPLVKKRESGQTNRRNEGSGKGGRRGQRCFFGASFLTKQRHSHMPIPTVMPSLTKAHTAAGRSPQSEFRMQLFDFQNIISQPGGISIQNPG